ncbi:MAG: alkyl hydroperoxide reductase subunit F [Bacteroidales bacterium]|jgi:alkyl hydroperoxide reductase subunit F|nr:alkyl hydroperoxide reductase subunit F [Bacteroidales bacterium]
MLDAKLKNQVRNIFADLQANYVLNVTAPPAHESKEEMLELLGDIAAVSDKITYHVNSGNELAFSIIKNNRETGVRFRGVPNGHEFSSLLLAILNSDGKGKNIPDDAICKRVKHLKTPIRLKTYVSLACTNCPDVVQALNLMAILNTGISHEMVDGGINEKEINKLKIKAIPAVYADGELLHVGKADFGELLDKLEQRYGIEMISGNTSVQQYDVVVLGGGPAGTSAAIYAARKGQKVALLAERIGGQVKETSGIENLISVPQTTGETLAAAMKEHLDGYAVDVLEHRRIESVVAEGAKHAVTVSGGERYMASSLIVATGAGWRRLEVPGETEYIGRGVAFCPHCDGPFYKGKHVAVIGGGNSGIEAAIDLAGICTKVTVFEFADTLKADGILQEKARNLPNVEIFTSSQTTEVIGNWEKITGIRVKNRITGDERVTALDGIFVQIGLTANSAIVKELVRVNERGEIEIDDHCRTSRAGIYAAGDVSTVPYKQIVIAMGEGAKAALSAFEDKIRGVHGQYL